MGNVLSTIRRRRAIYPALFTDKIITDEQLWQILEAANWAPSHRKTEPWRFKVFGGDARQKLSEFLGNDYESNTPPEKFSANKLKKKKEKPLQSSHVIAICVAYSGSDIVPQWEEDAAVACAVQNMWLACTKLELGGYWSTPKAMIGQPTILNLKENEKCLGLFYLGVPKAIALTVPGVRGDVRDKVMFV